MDLGGTGICTGANTSFLMSTATANRAASVTSEVLDDRHAVLFLITWGLGDTVSTLLASATVGAGLEANPLIRLALHTHPAAVIALKALAIAAVLAVWIYGGHHIRAAPGWQLWAFSVHALGAFVTVTNLAVVVLAA